jgi:citrate lyase subunit beta/citryl-CoA lyase
MINDEHMLPVWRSILFVPANVERFVERAHERGADAILIDLEDSIASSEKERARGGLPVAVRKISSHGVDVGVRVNRSLDLAVRDIEAAVIPGVKFLSLPKLEGPEHVRLLSGLIAELETARGLPAGKIRVIANVESAAGIWQLEKVARADPRVIALVLGSEDFALSAGVEPTREVLFLPKQLTVLAARAAGVMPLGLVESVANFTDLERFRNVAIRSSELGFVGSYAIHPVQVPILNEVFSPHPDAVASARAVLDAAKAAMKDGSGAFSFGGRMVDKPILDRAERLLARAEAIAIRQRAFDKSGAAGA